MKERLGADVELTGGRLGQFDVVVDGEVVASRTGLLRRLFGGGWPTADEVCDAVRGQSTS